MIFKIKRQRVQYVTNQYTIDYNKSNKRSLGVWAEFINPAGTD